MTRRMQSSVLRHVFHSLVHVVVCSPYTEQSRRVDHGSVLCGVATTWAVWKLRRRTDTYWSHCPVIVVTLYFSLTPIVHCTDHTRALPVLSPVPGVERLPSQPTLPTVH